MLQLFASAVVSDPNGPPGSCICIYISPRVDIFRETMTLVWTRRSKARSSFCCSGTGWLALLGGTTITTHSAPTSHITIPLWVLLLARYHRFFSLHHLIGIHVNEYEHTHSTQVP
jgi:hypothetical protein